MKKNLPNMRQTIYETNVLSHLLGIYEARKEAEKKAGKKLFKDDFEITDILDRAQQYFLKKKVISKFDFLKLTAEQRWDAFTIAHVTNKTILETVKEKLTKALESGIGIEDFVADIDKLFDAVGVTRLNPFHLDTVFLTNAMTGYGNGRKKLIDDLSIDEFPYRQVMAVGDDRTRDAHMEIDEYTAPKDDSVWTWLKTPFSYRCRCSISPVHKDEGASPSGYIPDVRGKRGFEFLKW